MPRQNKQKKPPREGFRRRINPYYEGMNKKQVAEDVAKTTARWLIGTILAYVYWLAILLIFSIFLLNVWQVEFTQILIYALILCIITSAVYAGSLVHKKFYY